MPHVLFEEDFAPVDVNKKSKRAKIDDAKSGPKSPSATPSQPSPSPSPSSAHKKRGPTNSWPERPQKKIRPDGMGISKKRPYMPASLARVAAPEPSAAIRTKVTTAQPLVHSCRHCTGACLCPLASLARMNCFVDTDCRRREVAQGWDKVGMLRARPRTHSAGATCCRSPIRSPLRMRITVRQTWMLCATFAGFLRKLQAHFRSSQRICAFTIHTFVRAQSCGTGLLWASETVTTKTRISTLQLSKVVCQSTMS